MFNFHIWTKLIVDEPHQFAVRSLRSTSTSRDAFVRRVSRVLCARGTYRRSEIIASSAAGFRGCVPLRTHVSRERARIHSQGTQDARLKLWKLAGVPRRIGNVTTTMRAGGGEERAQRTGGPAVLSFAEWERACTGTTPGIICHSAPLRRPKTRNRVSRTST